MNIPFKRLALAVTFSPNAKALLSETLRLKGLLNAELVLINVGKNAPETAAKFNDLLSEAGVNVQEVKLRLVGGDPADAIIQTCKEENVDLLISGALEKEKFLGYYIGSVARRIMRQAPCSVFVLTSPSLKTREVKSIFVEVDFSIESELAVRKAYDLAVLEKAQRFVLVHEFQVPGLAVTVQDTGSTQETERAISRWQQEEEAKMSVFVKELYLKDIPVETVSLFGKKGWEASQYVNEKHPDILVVPGPKKKLGMLDRIFQHDMEYILKSLPRTLLIIRS